MATDTGISTDTIMGTGKSNYYVAVPKEADIGRKRVLPWLR